MAGKGRVFRGFHTLTVDHTTCRKHIPPGRAAQLRAQPPVDLGKQAVFAPAAETVAQVETGGKSQAEATTRYLPQNTRCQIGRDDFSPCRNRFRKCFIEFEEDIHADKRSQFGVARADHDQ